MKNTLGRVIDHIEYKLGTLVKCLSYAHRAAASVELFPAQTFVHPSIYTLPLNTAGVAQLRACVHIRSGGAGTAGEEGRAVVPLGTQHEVQARFCR